jgi:hypothetical protein
MAILKGDPYGNTPAEIRTGKTECATLPFLD